MNNTILDYLAARAIEPSTWVSMGTMLSGLGIVIAPDKWQAIMGLGMGIGGFLGMVLRERKKTSATEIKNVVEAVVKPTALEPAPPPPKELEAIKANGH